MANFLSLQMTPPTYPVSGPVGAGRGSHNATGNFTLTGTMAVNDTIQLFKLHPRFRVHSGYVETSGLGAGVLLQVGDAGDTDRYFTAATAAAAGTRVDLADTGRDYLTTGFTPVFATVTGATSGATGTITVNLTGTIEQPQ